MNTHPLTRLFSPLVVLALCASAAPSQQIATATTTQAAGDAPAAQIQPASSSQFTLGASDVIRISVWKNADLSQTVSIGPDGFVSLPLLGDVKVAGMTANELGRTLAARLGTYIVNPQVTVSVVDIRSRQAFILGQVGRPGGYPLVAPVTVLQLIAEAGGLNTYANKKGIFILRGAGGSARKIGFNYNTAVRGDGQQNIVLEPGDTVVVP